MKQTLSKQELLGYVKNQIDYNFNDGQDHNLNLSDIVGALDKIEYCLKHIHLKYFNDGDAFFDHLFGDSYAMFLYFISRELFLRGEERGATKIFLLNKMLNGIDLYFTVSMPDIFYFTHPHGTVLGKAEYSDYLVVYQGVTVGSDMNEGGLGGNYPIFGKGAILFANSTVIGNCNIGNNVIFGANSFLRNTDIENSTIVLEQWPKNRFKRNTYQNHKYFFGK
jgi:serine O-acetyltransferase